MKHKQFTYDPKPQEYPWLERRGTWWAIVFAAFLLAGLLMAVLDKALSQAAYDAVNFQMGIVE